MRLKVVFLARSRRGRPEATIASKLRFTGRGRLARLLRRFVGKIPLPRARRLRWLT